MDHIHAHKHTLCGIYFGIPTAGPLGEVSPLCCALMCNINDRHKYAGGWKKRTINGRYSHPKENLGGTFIIYFPVILFLYVFSDLNMKQFKGSCV